MKHINLILSLLLLPVLCFAQGSFKSTDRQSFDGVWVFDEKASDAHPSLEELHKGETLEITLTEPEFKIVITQVMNLPEMKIDGLLVKKGERRSATIILFADNRGEINKPFPFNPTLEIGSKTEWNKNILVRSYATDVYISGKQEGDIKSTETYSVSKNGKVLTVTKKSKVTFTSGNDGKMKLVYKREG